jgi:hypothetical protein
MNNFWQAVFDELQRSGGERTKEVHELRPEYKLWLVELPSLGAFLLIFSRTFSTLQTPSKPLKHLPSASFLVSSTSYSYSHG